MSKSEIADDETIPICEVYRGVGIHVFQDAARIRLVKEQIDAVYDLDDLDGLFAYACEPRNPPEARTFAAAKIEAGWERAAERREVRPAINMELLVASVCGLNSLHWISPWDFGPLFDHGNTKRAAVLTDAEIERERAKAKAAKL